jgi:hypothetical protein
MAYTVQQLDLIYRRTTGYCHLCHKKLSRKNYGIRNARGAWEVEHSIPRSQGGTDHMNNLFAACISCNNDKSSLTTRTARSWHEKTCAPLCPEKRAEAKIQNGVIGAAVGGFAAAFFLGPFGIAICAIAGGLFAHGKNPDSF